MAGTRAEHRTRGARVVEAPCGKPPSKECLCGDVARKYTLCPTRDLWGGRGRTSFQAVKMGLNLPRGDEKSDDLEQNLINVKAPLLLF